MVKSEDMLLAGLYLDLKGRKKKRRDWISIAEDCIKLVELCHNSIKEAAEKIGVSETLMWAVVSLKDLPDEVQKLVKSGGILFDSAYRINTIKGKEKQIEIAKLIVGLSNKVQREIISQAKKYPDSDLVDFRKRILKEPEIKKKIHVVIIPMEDSEYKILENLSKKRNRGMEKLLSEIVTEWIQENRGRSK